MLFSPGAGGAPSPVVAGVVAVVVVVGVVVSGAFSSLAQPAVIAPIAMTAARPEIAARRRPERSEFMVQSYLTALFVAVNAGRFCRRRRRQNRRCEEVAPCGVDALLARGGRRGWWWRRRR